MGSISKLLTFWKKVRFNLVPVNITILFLLSRRKRALYICALIIEHLMQIQQLIPTLSHVFDNILDYLGGSVIFSKIDLAQGYHQVRIAKGHEHRTAFQTCFGLFEYYVLTIRLYNAPATFQRLIYKIVWANLDVFCTVYLDDILIFSWFASAHEQNLCWVL